jgi:dihydrofolate reductase
MNGLALIYARSLNRCIGADGGLPWSLPDEYEHFNQTTRGYPVIMGRRSYEDHDGALPDRLNIVVSRNSQLAVPKGIITATSLSDAIKVAAANNDQYFVIGGAGLLEEALPQANYVFETIVETNIEGDTYLPEFDFARWSTRELIKQQVDTQHDYAFSALLHTRR